MNKAVNTYWTDTRLATQRPIARTLTFPTTVRDLPRVNDSAVRTRVTRRGLAIPSWVLFCMIILATFAMCVTVTVRTHAEMNKAELKYEHMSMDVEQLRNTNASIQREVEQLRTNPRAIESAARARLNMVRANEIVVPIE